MGGRREAKGVMEGGREGGNKVLGARMEAGSPFFVQIRYLCGYLCVCVRV